MPMAISSRGIGTTPGALDGRGHHCSSLRRYRLLVFRSHLFRYHLFRYHLFRYHLLFRRVLNFRHQQLHKAHFLHSHRLLPKTRNLLRYRRQVVIMILSSMISLFNGGDVPSAPSKQADRERNKTMQEEVG